MGARASGPLMTSSLLGARHSVALMGCVIHKDAPRSGALPAMSRPDARGPMSYSRTITFSSEECTFSSPLYSISPSLRNLFMK